MQTVDAIILTNTKDLNLYGLTQRTINTLKWSESDYIFDAKVIESNKNHLEQGFIYHDCNTIVPDEPFKYNKFLNHGLKHCKSPWLVVCNNDLIFTQGWFSKLMKFHDQHPDVKSLSPFEPNWHLKRGMDSKVDVNYGYRTSYEITGWCLVIHREIIEQCNLFDDQFDFWYQDNDYAETIRAAKYKHALVTNSRVYHMVSGSHHLLEGEEKHNMTAGQHEVFLKKWGNK